MNRTAPVISERRRSPRVPHVMDAWISSPTATDPEDFLEATCVSLSRHGVGFVLDEPLPTRSFYVIKIGLGDQRMTTEVRVLSCQSLPDGKFDIGAEFC